MKSNTSIKMLSETELTQITGGKGLPWGKILKSGWNHRNEIISEFGKGFSGKHY